MIFASWFVMRYARQVQQDKSRSVLADIAYDDEFSQMKSGNLAFTGKQKLTMLVFFGTFLLMIYAVVPWSDLGIDALPRTGITPATVCPSSGQVSSTSVAAGGCTTPAPGGS